MRYVRTDRFKADYARLSAQEKALLQAAVRRFNDACDSEPGTDGRPVWPKRLRVKAVQGAPGVWELTWSFAARDGRATWEWATVTVEGVEHPAVRWRRVGGHAIFGDP